MSALITDKLVTPCGSITNETLGGYVDAAGNVVGSPGFLPNYVVDYAGNIGSLSFTGDCTFIATIIGSAIPPGEWEMQVGTATETVGADAGTIASNFVAGATAATVLSTFVSKNATGYLTGVVSAGGTWTIKSGPEAIAGTGYIGSGLLVASGANTHSGPISMQVGTQLQLGADCSNTTTRALGGVTLAEGAVLTQYTSYVGNTFLAQALNNDGTYNVTGCGACGVGGVGLATTVTNNGIINLDKTSWRNQSTWSGAGTVNVKSGATFQLTTNAIGNTTRINLNGNGWKDAACVEQGALHATGSATIGARINVQSASTIKTASGVTVTYSGVLTGSAPLTVTTLSATKPNGVTHFSNTANTYNGTMTVDGTTLNASYGTSLQYAKMNLINSGSMSSSASQTVGSLSGDSTATWRSADFLNHFIKANGVTTYAGKLLWNGGSNTANWFLEGGSANVLTMTGTGSTGNMYVRNGSKLILQGGTWTGTNGQIRVSGGSTVSAGTLSTGGAVLIYIDETSALDVYAQGGSTAKINTGPGTSSLSAGWKVNLKSPLPAGTHGIWWNTGAAITQLPIIGENLSGRTVTGFFWNNAATPKTLSVYLA